MYSKPTPWYNEITTTQDTHTAFYCYISGEMTRWTSYNLETLISERTRNCLTTNKLSILCYNDNIYLHSFNLNRRLSKHRFESSDI